jgi:peptide/nickel transport system permease protein
MEIKVDKSVEAKNEKILTPGKIVWNRLKKNKLAIAGMFLLIFMILVCIFGPMIIKAIMGYTDESFNMADAMLAPCSAHWLGTDQLGRDILARLLYAGRISLTVGLVAVLIDIFIGSVLGAIAGFYGGVVDSIIMRIVDIFLCVPFLPILIVLGAMMSDWKVPPQNRIYLVMVIIGILDWPGTCRIVRGQILTLREQEFMQAAEALGLRDRKKMFKHLLPNTFPSIIVTATLGIGGAILTESALSYLGLGVMPPIPSWGNMIQEVNDMYAIQYYSWLWMPPGICILLTVVAINLFGDGLRDALDPKLKK